MKFCNYDIDTYNSKMVLSREEILKMDKDPTTIINDLFSVIYHIGLNNFTSDSTVSGKLDKIYELQIWPSMDQTMAEINSASTMKHRIREQNQSAMGVIQANYTSNSNKQPTKSFINSKPIHKPMYKPQSRIVDKRCLICLGPHRAAECDREPTQCKKSLPNGTICTGLHHPQMHDIWMKIKGINASKPSYQPSNRPNPKSAKSLMQMRAMEAEMVYERDIELDADQYDTLIALEAMGICDSSSEAADTNHDIVAEEQTTWEDYDAEISDIVRDGEININAYPVLIIDNNTNHAIEVDEEVICLNGFLDNDDGIRIPPILVKCDSACNGVLIEVRYVGHPTFYNVRPCSHISVIGVNKDKKTAVSAKYVGIHPRLGTVYFGDWASSLMGVNVLFKRGYRITGEANWIGIINVKTNKVIYHCQQTKDDMFVADIAVYPTPAHDKDLFDQAAAIHANKASIPRALSAIDIHEDMPALVEIGHRYGVEDASQSISTPIISVTA